MRVASPVVVEIPAPPLQRTRSTSRIYPFSEEHIAKYERAKRRGSLRHPDLFMYHISRSTADVQREARLLRDLDDPMTIKSFEMAVPDSLSRETSRTSLVSSSRFLLDKPTRFKLNVFNSILFVLLLASISFFAVYVSVHDLSLSFSMALFVGVISASALRCIAQRSSHKIRIRI